MVPRNRPRGHGRFFERIPQEGRMQEPAVLIARRVGAIGPRRPKIVGALRRALCVDAGRIDLSLGLSIARIRTIADQFAFAELAGALPSRGDGTRLEQIAWFGSALGDVACAVEGTRDDEVLSDAALFNVSVALFDTVSDDKPHLLPRLVGTVNPEALRPLLLGGDVCATDASENGDDLTIVRLASLFRHVVARAGRRFAGQDAKLASLDASIRLMFDSETRAGASRRSAKTLPVTFIGALATRAVSSPLFTALGEFLALYDDWQDLGDDIVRGRANSFVQLVDGADAPTAYWVSAAAALIAPSRIEARLVAAERRVLDASDCAGTNAGEKTRRLLSWLFGPT